MATTGCELGTLADDNDNGVMPLTKHATHFFPEKGSQILESHAISNIGIKLSPFLTARL